QLAGEGDQVAAESVALREEPPVDQPVKEAPQRSEQQTEQQRRCRHRPHRFPAVDEVREDGAARAQQGVEEQHQHAQEKHPGERGSGDSVSAQSGFSRGVNKKYYLNRRGSAYLVPQESAFVFSLTNFIANSATAAEPRSCGRICRPEPSHAAPPPLLALRPRHRRRRLFGAGPPAPPPPPRGPLPAPGGTPGWP